MTEQEWKAWKAVTEDSRYRWHIDDVSCLNGKGDLYYLGGVDGIYIQIGSEGKLTIGHYEGAYPHIGEALFKPSAVKDCGSYDNALHTVAGLVGLKFWLDICAEYPIQAADPMGLSEPDDGEKQQDIFMSL